MDTLQKMLAAANQPFVILGGGGWDTEACADIQEFAVRWDLPVGVSFRCQDYFDNEHDHYAGDVGIGINPKLAARVRDADILIVLGARLGEMTTGGYELINIPEPHQDLVHVYPGAEEIGRVYHPKLGINAGMRAMATALKRMDAPKSVVWSARRKQAREELLEWRQAPEIPGNVQMGEIMTFLRSELPQKCHSVQWRWKLFNLAKPVLSLPRV